MVTTPQQLAGHVEIVSGLGAAAAALGIGIDALVRSYPTFALATQGRVRVATSDRFDFLSVTARRVNPTTTSTPARDDFVELLQRRGADEIESVDHGLGAPRAGVDLELLGARGVHAGALSALRERIRCLDPEEQTVGWSLIHGSPKTWAVHVRFPAREEGSVHKLLQAAAAAGVTKPQCRLLERVHPVLARRRNVMVSFPCGEEEAQSAMHVHYPFVSMEHVLRLLAGVFPSGQHATQLGQLAGATRTDDATIFSLELGDAEPIGFRIAVEMPAA